MTFSLFLPDTSPVPLDPPALTLRSIVMKRPIRVSPLSHGRISVVFSDGLEGVIDMSSSVGRGVFARLTDPQVFAGVHIGDRGQIAWSEEMEICPDAAYLEVAGQNACQPAHV